MLPAVLTGIGLDEVHTVVWAIHMTLRSYTLDADTIRERLTLSDCLLPLSGDGSAPSPELPGPVTALAVFATRCWRSGDEAVWQWCRGRFAAIGRDPLDVVDAAAGFVLPEFASWHDSPMAVLTARDTYVLVPLDELPMWHNPGRCGLRGCLNEPVTRGERLRGLLLGVFSRNPSMNVAVRLQADVVAGRVEPCTMHFALLDWSKLHRLAVEVRDLTQPWGRDEVREAVKQLPGLTAHETNVLSSLFLDPIRWVRGIDQLVNGQHRSCMLRTAGETVAFAAVTDS